VLEQTILKAKGLSEEQLAALAAMGVNGKSDFATIGSVETLLEVMPGLDAGVAGKVMEWAVGAPAAPKAAAVEPATVMVDSADVAYCVHCKARQPKDYNVGDLCPSCGKQAEPVLSCHWCGASGPGKFCRGCGAEFVAQADLDLAVLLKREGVDKEQIAKRIKALDAAEREALWSRVRRFRG